jgi:2-polyprenyl-3-methyl-5-hydroxy-6-metoxy-1,4-benzoquinol methylase
LSSELLDTFLDRFTDPALADTIAKQTGEPLDAVAQRFEMYRNEASLGWDVASRVVRPGARILEVGSGLGFVSLALRHAGYDVVGLEPVGQGFDFFEVARGVVRSAAADVDLEVLDIGGEQLDPSVHGRFDAIFSVHVLEHVPDLPAVFRAMTSVLAPGGAMAHICPNYTLPYEPHLGIPLVPFAPQATAKVFPKRVARQREMWESLNFVTARQIRTLATQNGLDVTFERGVLYDFVQRLATDPVFAERHQSRAMKTLGNLDERGWLKFLARVPAGVASPMIFTLRAR